jgi:hypothetical protein
MSPKHFHHDIEGRLRFQFDADSWIALKWDDDSAFREGLMTTRTTTAIDLVGVHRGTTLYLIEVKDPRGFRIQYRRTLTSGELVTIVCNKVRDTLSALPWAWERVPSGHDHLLPYLRALYVERPTKIVVVLWLEDADKKQALQIKGPLERRLAWLKPTVHVVNRALVGDLLAGLNVSSLAAALPGQP